jgi:DNA (cytosine-5)-methyltransferase 1
MKLNLPYSEYINSTLKPKDNNFGTILDLFAGCGGLSLGFESVGFKTIGFESNLDCCETYNKNLNGHCHNVHLTPEYKFPSADIVIGGPPCQPFSVGGEQKGIEDSRDGFPIFISAVEQLKPDIFLFENVRGLLYKNKWYLLEIIERLEKLGYQIDVALLNAVDYLVPQNRERVIVVGHFGGYIYPPKIENKVSVGIALDELINLTPDNPKFLNSSMDRYIEKYEKASKCITPRDLHFHKPARTLTCRNLAGATGDMHRIKLPDGSRRRLTVREAARLQSFPDWFEFKGNETSQFNQIGNAVPPLLSYQLAQSVINYLEQEKVTAVTIQKRFINIQKEIQFINE